MTLKKMCITLAFVAAIIHPIVGQNIQLQKSRDMAIGSSSLLLTGLTFYTTRNYPTPQRTWQMAGVDAWNSPTYHSGAAKISDATFVGTTTAAALVGLSFSKDQQIPYGIVMAQNLMITGNLVQFTKVLAGRSRPYMQETGYVAEFGKDNYYSFFSGHSALSSTMATTALLAACRQQGSMNWGQSVAVTSAALALGTGILRISAGKHYPSDVLMGILVGSGVALINSMIHENK